MSREFQDQPSQMHQSPQYQQQSSQQPIQQSPQSQPQQSQQPTGGQQQSRPPIEQGSQTGGQQMGSSQMGGQQMPGQMGGQQPPQQTQQPITQQMGGQQGQTQPSSQPAEQFEDHFTDELRLLLEDFDDVTHVAEWCAVQCLRSGPELADCARVCEDIAELAELNEKLIARDSMFGPEVADLFVRVATEGLPELQRHQQRHPHVMETIATIERTIQSCQTVLQTVGGGGQQMSQPQMGGQQTGGQMGGQQMSPPQMGGQQTSGQMGGQQTGGQMSGQQTGGQQPARPTQGMDDMSY